MFTNIYNSDDEGDDVFNPQEMFEMFASSSSSSYLNMSSDASSCSDISSSLSSDFSSDSNTETKSRSSRTTYSNDDWYNSLFYKQYIDPAVTKVDSPLQDPTSYIGKI